MHPAHPLRIFAFSGIVSILIAIAVAWFGGIGALWLFIILAILEVTFSFDNAVINSRILVRMSRFWQILFLTVGIFIAVFVVRFALPIIIVQLATGLNFMDVINMALNQPERYGEVCGAGNGFFVSVYHVPHNRGDNALCGRCSHNRVSSGVGDVPHSRGIFFSWLGNKFLSL